RPDIGTVLEWNFESPPYSVESEYGGPNFLEWAETQGGLTRVPLATRVRLLGEVARAVAAAHDAGVIHKDLKPANILVTPSSSDVCQIRVVDFGSASVVDRERLKALGITNLGLTQTVSARESSLTGSLMYLAPELFSGAAPAASADVFALGVMLYQLAIGDFRKPLAAGWEADVDDLVLREDIADAACGDPARRCKSASDLADRLERIEARRRDRDVIEQQRDRELAARRRQTDARIRRPWMVAAAPAMTVAAPVSA